MLEEMCVVNARKNVCGKCWKKYVVNAGRNVCGKCSKKCMW